MALEVLLPKENLYADGFIVTNDINIGQLLKRNKINYFGRNPNDRVHLVVQDEKIWNIASKYYGNSKWWHIIMDANDIENPFELPIGEEILIPDVDTIIAAR